MKSLLAGLLASFALSTSVSAAVITYENRATDSGVDRSDYRSSWLAQDSSIFSRDLDEFTNLRANGSNRNQHSHLNFSFDVTEASVGKDWLFQFAVDAGLGGAVYVNGTQVYSDTSNLWWGRNWDRTNELLTASLNDVQTGSYEVDVFWAENCCNGWQSGRFSVDGNDWYELSTYNLEAVGVPEPGSIAFMLIGFAGLVTVRKLNGREKE